MSNGPRKQCTTRVLPAALIARSRLLSLLSLRSLLYYVSNALPCEPATAYHLGGPFDARRDDPSLAVAVLAVFAAAAGRRLAITGEDMPVG